MSNTYTTTETGENPPRSSNPADEDEISLLDLLIVLAKRKWLIFSVTLFFVLAAVVISLLMRPVYTAEVQLLPPQQRESGAAAMLSQVLGGAAGLAGGALGIKNSNDLYVGMLKSREIRGVLIKQFGLQKRYETKTLDDTLKALESRTEIKTGKDGIISIAVDDRDPRFAARVANAYPIALDRLTNTLAVTEAAQKRIFFEKQLKEAQVQLANAEDQLRNVQERTGLIELGAQATAVIQSVAQARAQIAAKEVQLASMRAYAAPGNPDLRRVQQELDELRANLKRLEQRNSAAGDVMVPTGKVPQLGLEYTRQFREVKYRETLFELMAKQVEMARLEEAQNAPLIQVLDKATPPAYKSKPKRALMVALAGVVGLFIGIFWAFIREAAERQRQDPEQAERLNLLHKYLWSR